MYITWCGNIWFRILTEKEEAKGEIVELKSKHDRMELKLYLVSKREKLWERERPKS